MGSRDHVHEPPPAASWAEPGLELTPSDVELWLSCHSAPEPCIHFLAVGSRVPLPGALDVPHRAISLCQSLSLGPYCRGHFATYRNTHSRDLIWDIARGLFSAWHVEPLPCHVTQEQSGWVESKQHGAAAGCCLELACETKGGAGDGRGWVLWQGVEALQPGMLVPKSYPNPLHHNIHLSHSAFKRNVVGPLRPHGRSERTS